jgi:hypothetical protein
MRNSLIADSLGFNSVVLLEDGFQKRWAIFRESEQSKFLQLLSEKWISELQRQMEGALPEDLNKLQGQIFEAKKFLAFLAQPSIANEVNSTAVWLGIKKS